MKVLHPGCDRAGKVISPDVCSWLKSSVVRVIGVINPPAAMQTWRESSVLQMRTTSSQPVSGGAGFR